MAHAHPPSARRKARTAVAGGPPGEGSFVLCAKRAESLHRFGRRASMTGRSKLRVEAPECFVALGSFGVGEVAACGAPGQGQSRIGIFFFLRRG
jgi:hypothetical protein